MRPIPKIIASIALSVAFLVIAVFPVRVKALVPPLVQFGGWDVFTLPCTCSPATWGFFAPLYLGPAPVAGPLVYFLPGTVPFANFLTTVPSVPHKGGFVPGVQACWMYAAVACFPMPSLGVMGFVGTGLPGGK